MAPPFLQQNARLPSSGTIQVRVGLPHTGGRLASECFRRGYPAMVSASAFLGRDRQTLFSPEISSLYDLDIALDSAGFVAMHHFSKRPERSRGIAGIYPWSLTDYMQLTFNFGGALSFWSQPDFACEPELAADREQREWRIRATATLLYGCLQQVECWQDEFRSTPGGNFFLETEESRWRVGANLIRPPLPVLQGWTADDYRLSADMMLDVWSRWSDSYECVLAGVGSVCRRDLSHPVHGIEAVLRAIDDYLPPSIKLHLFGVKGTAIRALQGHPRIASVDSMAYDFGARMSARKHRVPCTMQHRVDAMNAWMSRQTRHTQQEEDDVA